MQLVSLSGASTLQLFSLLCGVHITMNVVMTQEVILHNFIVTCYTWKLIRSMSAYGFRSHDKDSVVEFSLVSAHKLSFPHSSKAT